jgi:hypothetical protein
MVGVPLPCELGDCIEGAGLFEQVRGVGDDGKPVLTAQPGLGLAVEGEHDLVEAADDEQCGCGDVGEAGGGQVWSAAAGDDGGDVRVRFGGGPQRSGGAGVGAEVANGQPAGLRPFA